MTSQNVVGMLSLLAVVTCATPHKTEAIPPPDTESKTIDVATNIPPDALPPPILNESYVFNAAAQLSPNDRSLLERFLTPLPDIQPKNGFDELIHENIGLIVNIQQIPWRPKPRAEIGWGTHIGNGLVVTATHVIAEYELNTAVRNADVIGFLHPETPYGYDILACNAVSDIALIKIPTFLSDGTTPLLYLDECSRVVSNSPTYFIDTGVIKLPQRVTRKEDKRPPHLPITLGTKDRLEPAVFAQGIGPEGGSLYTWILRTNIIFPSDDYYIGPGDSGFPVFDTTTYRMGGLVIVGPTQERDGTVVNDGGIADACRIREFITHYLAATVNAH